MNIHSGIAVAIVPGTACRTGPLAIAKAKIMMDIATDRTPFARREVALHQTEVRPGLFGHMRQEASKVAVSKVADPAAPKTLHTAKFQVFNLTPFGWAYCS